MLDAKNMRVLLVGNPNVGKTTLFNAWTGSSEKVANQAGVTVESKEKTLSFGNTTMVVVDTPGIYRLSDEQLDEAETLRCLNDQDNYDGIIYVASARELDRHLYLFFRLLSYHKPLGCIVTLCDELPIGTSIDTDLLSQQLGVPVEAVGRNMAGSNERALQISSRLKPTHLNLSTETDITALHLLSRDTARACTKVAIATPPSTAIQLDRYLTHALWGPLVFLFTMAMLFQALFWGAEPFVQGLEFAVTLLQRGVDGIPYHWLGKGSFRDLLRDGIIGGTGGILVFLPQIIFISAAIQWLEESGYLARITFLVDRLMRSMGLNGSAFIPLLSAHACAVPAITSLRGNPDQRMRMLLMITLPLVTCSARLPIYALITSLMFPYASIGPFHMGGLVLFALYAIAFASAILAAFLFKRLLIKAPLLQPPVEFPPYRWPQPINILKHAQNRALGFLKETGTLILAFSILLWALSYFPRQHSPGEGVVAAKLEHSYLGVAGKALEPVFKPLGFDWRISVALLSAFSAREVFVSTLAIAFEEAAALDEAEGEAGFRKKLSKATWPDGRPLFTMSTGLAIMIFFVFAAQCMSTLAMVRKESGTWRWPVFMMLYMNTAAFFFAWLTKTIVTHVYGGG